MEETHKKEEFIIRSFNVTKTSYETLESMAEEADVSVSHLVRAAISLLIASAPAGTQENKQDRQP